MHISAFRVQNFRRLRDVQVDLDSTTTIFVGANNSGKTSATTIFQLFLGEAKGSFSLHDFSSHCWLDFNRLGDSGDPDQDFPSISLDIWLAVDPENDHRVVDLIPDLSWEGEEVGVRITFAPRDRAALLANYKDARDTADRNRGEKAGSYRPWPKDMSDYLRKRLLTEYQTIFDVIDRADASTDAVVVRPLAANSGIAASIVDSLIRVDFLDAQRNLADNESRGRYEDLSKRLSRYYARHLTKSGEDLDALSALTDSEDRMNEHFEGTFRPLLGELQQLGYPGVGNHEIVVKAEFNPSTILSSNAYVHYSLTGLDDDEASISTLPARYNGLGFKNLIFMAIEILDFHRTWIETTENRPPIHLIMIEEPESHLHAQLQQVFIRKILSLLSQVDDQFNTQMVVTTHSPHIVYESEFSSIRYFRREATSKAHHTSDVRNLSKFYNQTEESTRDFLLQYLKLTHCDLFFADAALLVEGNVERLTLPLMIERDYPALRASRITILEVGGAFAHRFDALIDFLDIPSLVVTDLDSVVLSATSERPEEEDVDEESEVVASPRAKACIASTAGAVTSNAVLKKWVPKLELVADLLACPDEAKFAFSESGESRPVKVTYQTLEDVTWGGATLRLAGRTFEEAFALANLSWTQDEQRASLGLRIRGADRLTLDVIYQRLHNRVRRLDKTAFALALISDRSNDWTTPSYISRGLEWLEELVGPPVAPLDPDFEGAEVG